MKPPSDFPISDLRLVRYRYKGDTSRWHEARMHFSQVQIFLQAMLELHYEPGVNPHILKHEMGLEGVTLEQATARAKTSVVWEITENTLTQNNSSPYWWATPGLGTNKGSLGAHLLVDYAGVNRLWAHPELLVEEAEMERFESEYD